MDDPTTCACLSLDAPWFYTHFEERDVGIDDHYADISVRRCKDCGRYWLNYHYENSFFTGSGRYYRVVISPELAASLKPEEAYDLIARAEWYICGGSFFDGKICKGKGPPNLWP